MTRKKPRLSIRLRPADVVALVDFIDEADIKPQAVWRCRIALWAALDKWRDRQGGSDD
jgi:hypothetical protein